MIILLSLFPFTSSQSQNSNNINFKVEGERLSIALRQLTSLSGLNFTYDASDDYFNTIVKYEARKPALAILEDLLKGSRHTYKVIGNQIVIYIDKDAEVIEEPNQIIGNEDSNISLVPALAISENNLTVIDTVFITTTDTVLEIITDTIRIVDTIFIAKEIPAEVDSSLLSKELNNLEFDQKRIDGWNASLYFAPIVSDFSLANEESKISMRHYSFGLELSKVISKLNISAGIKLSRFSEKYNNTYNVSEGGFFVTDTIDEYYTISGPDTSWYFVTDSTYSPLNLYEYSYNINNRLGYLDFVLTASYDFYSVNNIKLYAKLGFQANILIYKNGIAIPDADEPQGINFDDLKFATPTFSVLAGLGMKYKLSNRLDLNPELFYFSNFNDLIVDYPSSKKLRGAGLRLGVLYYF